MKLKILTFNWHEVYIHLLAKTGYEFDVVERWKGGRYGWINEFRPIPPNCCLISEDEAKAKLEKDGYDRIICHNLQDFALVSESVIPKVLLHHCTLTVECGALEKDKQKELLWKLHDIYSGTKDLTLVFVSPLKKESWGFDGEVILPGIDTTDYGDYEGNIKKVLRVGNFLKEADIVSGYSIHERILNGISVTVVGLNPMIQGSYLPKDWEDLKRFMRNHRVYINTTMPPYEDGYNLAMLESMATGMPVVSLANPTSPIEDGVSGYVSSDERYLRERIGDLLNNQQLSQSIGKRSREMVMDRFPIERFIRNWKRVLGDVSYRGKVFEKLSCAKAGTERKLKILMSYASHPATTAVYIEKAFRKHHDVITYGPVITDNIWGVDILKEWNIEILRDRVKGHDIPYFASDLKEVIQRLPTSWSPDIFLWIETGAWYEIEGLDGLPCPSACYLIDVHLSLERRLEFAKNFDYVFIAQKEYLPKFKEAGIERVFWLPLACDPDIHGKKPGEKIYDINFVGSLNNQRRIELLNKLKGRFNLYYERCFLEKMAEVFSQSKIVFNNSVNNDLNMRVFEALCSGSMLITDEAGASGLADLFKDKKHLVIYRDEEELMELAGYYLKNDSERERIAEQGRKEVLSKHTYEHRVSEMIQIISSFQDKKKTYSGGYILDSHPEAVVLQPYCSGRGVEVGCGFRKTHPDVIGVDIIGKGEVGEHGCVKGMQSVADIKASGDDLYMFKDGELDYVVSRHNLEHYVDIVKTLKEWKRVLKEGGVLGIVLPDESKLNTIALDPTHKHCFTPDSIKNLLGLIGGFNIERLEPVIENWSFVVIARKIKERIDNMNIDIRGTAEAIGNDYYRQERREVEALIPKECMKILDVGCGEGALGKRLLERGAKEVTGIEINPLIAKSAEKNLTGVLCVDIETMMPPFSKGYFDCIIFADVLEHLKEPLLLLNQYREYLSDKGVVIASIPNVRYHGVINMLIEGRWKYEDYGILDRTHLRFFTKKEITDLFQDAGFEITGITENVDPQYNDIDPLLQNISIGRITLNGLAPDELKDLFVVQYLIRAQKSIHHRLNVGSGNLEDQRLTLEKFLEAHQADLDGLYRYAEVCHKLGMLDKAVESLEKILIFEPEREAAVKLKSEIMERHHAGKRL